MLIRKVKYSIMAIVLLQTLSIASGENIDPNISPSMIKQWRQDQSIIDNYMRTTDFKHSKSLPEALDKIAMMNYHKLSEDAKLHDEKKFNEDEVRYKWTSLLAKYLRNHPEEEERFIQISAELLVNSINTETMKKEIDMMKSST